MSQAERRDREGKPVDRADVVLPGILQDWRQELIRGVLTALVVAGALAVVAGSVNAYSSGQVWVIPVYLVVYSTVCLAKFWRRVPYAVKAWLVIGLIYGLAILDFFQDGRGGSGRLFLVTVPFAAALFFGRRAGIGALVVVILSLVIVGALFSAGVFPFPLEREVRSADLTGWISNTVVVLMLGLFLVISLNYLLPRFAAALSESHQLLRQLEQQRAGLEAEVISRTRGLQAVAQVSQATTSVLDPDSLLPQIVDLVRERFELYYVGLFLLDEEKQFAVLRAGTGEAGWQMLAQGHRLEVGRSSMIGRCVATGKADVQLDVGEAAVRFDNPLLPLTRSEAALPLRSRGRTIGAMTVQSEEPSAFDDASVAVLQTMADQVAVAIDNAQLYAEAQSALQEMTASQRRYLAQAWSEHLKTAESRAYETERPGPGIPGDAVWSEIQQALAHQRVTSLRAGEGKVAYTALVTPISFRGEVIGALGIHDEDAARQWSEDDIAIVEAVIERMGIVADSLRLLTDTQCRETTERLVREVADKMRRAPDMNALIRTTVQELSAALGTSDAFLQLSTALDTTTDTS